MELILFVLLSNDLLYNISIFSRFTKHLAKLVDAVHITNSTSIDTNDLQKAEDSLISYVEEFELLYGESNMVYNVHQLLHICKCVKVNGPLFTYSNYSMEDNIGHLVSLVKGTTDVASQINTKYTLEKSLFEHLEKSPRARDFYERIERKLSFPVATELNGTLVVGKALQRAVLNEQDVSLIKEMLNLNENDHIIEYSSIFLKSKIFYESLSNSINKRTNDSFICSTATNHFADIKSIFVIRDQIFLFINEKYDIIEDIDCESIIFLKVFMQ